MAEYLIQDTTLDAIADAINAKTGGSSAMTPAEMVTAIGNISGGGAAGYELLASGSYTYTGAETGQISIPVSYSGTAVYAYAYADTIIPDIKQSYAFFVAIAVLPFLPYFPNNKSFGMVSGAETTGAVSYMTNNDATRVSNNIFYLNRFNNNYKIQPNTYHWFIYGVKET